VTIMGETTVEHARRRVVAEFGDEFVPGPGKFEGETVLTYALWEASMISGEDDSLGDVDGFGWYALFAEEGAILHTDIMGFVSAVEFDTAEACATAWAELEAEYTDWLDEADEDTEI
jgi:hypothetical protein